MRIVNKNNKTIYKYEKHELSIGVKTAIILFAVAILLLLISILISFLYLGEAPYIVGGFGIASLLFNIASMLNIILDIYFYGNFHIEIRNMLILQILFFIIWIFII